MMETDTICPVYTITSQILRYNKGYIIEKGRKLGYEIQGNDDSCTGTEELWRML